VIYTAGRDSQYQNTIVADAAPLITAPVIVCTFTFEIFTPNILYLFSFITFFFFFFIYLFMVERSESILV